MTPTEYIWMNGELVKWDDAKIHVCSHVIHYGSSVFEGMRIYKTPKGPAAFRLRDHSDRLLDSAKIYRMPMKWTPEEIDQFTSDPDEHAYEKLIDRLLASEHYGERWARHWMDVARFAESGVLRG